MSRYTRKYEVEILSRTPDEAIIIDSVLTALAAQGIWVSSNRETHPPTGAVLGTLPLAPIYNNARKGA